MSTMFRPIATPGMQRMVATLKVQAELGFSRGDGVTPYLIHCTADHESGARCMFTRDIGHHTSGWLKNPDYERCYHLSVSFRDPATGESRPFDHRAAQLWVDLFYGPLKRHIWAESPKSPAGIQRGVWHYRVFCDAHWQPITPRGEVYATEFTERGWLSWSEAKDYAMSEIMRSAT